MANLLVIVYPDVATAEAAYETTKGLEAAGYLDVLDSAVIVKTEDGKLAHHGERHPVRRGAVAGAVLGGILGTFFLIPGVGAAAGAAIGGYAGKLDKSGGSGDFREVGEEVMAKLEPGGAAIVLLAYAPAYDRSVAELSRHGGKVLSRDVSEEQLAKLQAELDNNSAK